MTGEGEGRFTAEVMTAAMRQIAADLAVSTDDAELLRLTNNAVFALPGAGIVIRIIRITRSTTFVDRVQKVARLAQWFARVQAPTVRLLASVDQPVAANGFLATVWHYVTPTPPAPTYEELGQVLRRFHELGVPPFALPAWDPVGDARRRLADAEALADNDRAFLEHWCDQLAPRVADLNQRTKPGLVHADAHAGNLIRGPDHKVVLCDFDATCLGPWQVDLASVAAGEVRFGRSGAHRALATAYGYDVTTDPDWPLLRQARELKLVTAAVIVATLRRVLAAARAWRFLVAVCGEPSQCLPDRGCLPRAAACLRARPHHHSRSSMRTFSGTCSGWAGAGG